MEKRLYYIWHDCFVYQGQKAIIVFDFYYFPRSEFNPVYRSFIDFISDLAKNGCNPLPVYVLVSHHHKDHFTRDIFKWTESLTDVHYIISKDTERAVRYLLKPGSTYKGSVAVKPGQVTVLKEGERYQDDVLKVSAFGSTDIGNSYVTEVDGLTIFHAGDLNAWVWKDESTASEIKIAIDEFKTKLKPIVEAFPRIDCAMFPVDKRIGRDWWEGARIFVRSVDVDLFVPMHFCLFSNEEERIDFARGATKFDDYANPEHGHYSVMTFSGECLIL